jgi:hypothetical protein
MERIVEMVNRFVLVLIAAIVATGVVASVASAQGGGASAARKTAPPSSWMEKWVGMYEGQDREGKIAPPGFKVLYPPEPDTIDLVDSLSQPWARARREATNFELEDPGQICRPTGPLRGNSTSEFQLLASPETITIIGGTGGGILTAGIRRIYMNRGHLKNPPLTFMGDWIGHWERGTQGEGETLVLSGKGFNEQTWLTRDRQRHTEAMEISERWRFVANDQWIEKTITVDDRFALTQPYTVTRYFKKLSNDTPQLERLCLDEPAARRAWVKLYKQYERDWEQERRNIKVTEER